MSRSVIGKPAFSSRSNEVPGSPPSATFVLAGAVDFGALLESVEGLETVAVCGAAVLSMDAVAAGFALSFDFPDAWEALPMSDGRSLVRPESSPKSASGSVAGAGSGVLVCGWGEAFA